MLARLRRLFPEMSAAADIATLFDGAFTEQKIAGELAYLARPLSGGFERPYGWAWLLMLAGELRRGDGAWSEALRPLEQAFVARFTAYLPKLTYPVRAGTHNNTAFALILAADYARGNAEFRRLLEERARAWFGHDRGAVAWEPSGEDFLSPTLTEAACMRALLPPEEFARVVCRVPAAAWGRRAAGIVRAGDRQRSQRRQDWPISMGLISAGLGACACSPMRSPASRAKPFCAKAPSAICKQRCRMFPEIIWASIGSRPMRCWRFRNRPILSS